MHGHLLRLLLNHHVSDIVASLAVSYSRCRYIPPEKMQKPFLFSSACFVITLIGLLVWSVSAAGGAGPLWSRVRDAAFTHLKFLMFLLAWNG